MKRLYHWCISSPNEVLFRDEEDIKVGVNCYALTLFHTGSDSLSDSFMSNHIHTMIFTNDIRKFGCSMKSRYSIYFQNKYHTNSICERASVFYSVIDGLRHRIAAISYVNRNGLHHGQSSTAFGYPHSSVNLFYRKELGKTVSDGPLLSGSDIAIHLPRHSSFPDNYMMDRTGMIIRESFTQIQQVEIMYGSARAFLYYMNRLSTDSWKNEQMEDDNGSEPVTLNTVEFNTTNATIEKLHINEQGKCSNNRMTDIEICKIIDRYYVPKYKKESVYHLSESEKKTIANEIYYRYHISGTQIIRCLIILLRKIVSLCHLKHFIPRKSLIAFIITHCIFLSCRGLFLQGTFQSFF